SATVTGGIFATNLNFGSGAFAAQQFRFLEIAVRLNGSGQPYTILTPRQQVTSTPYAIRSMTANDADHAVVADDSGALGGIPAAQYVITTDSRMSDARTPLPNSEHYIQNGTSQQAASNFNVSGTGKAGSFDAATQYNIGGARFLGGSAASGNVFAGAMAGNANPAAGANTFVGGNSGKITSTGYQNSFFGFNSGQGNTTGHDNSMFGNYVGFTNTTGNANAFFGAGTGFSNQAGHENAFFGMEAGWGNTTGSRNTIIGRSAGLSNTTENDNTFIGYKANGAAGITNATAIGANAVVTESNSMVLGTAPVTVKVPGSLNVANTFTANILNSGTTYQIDGVTVFNTNGTKNVHAGADSGTASTGSFNAFLGNEAGKSNTTGSNNTFVGFAAGRNNSTGQNNAYFGASAGAFANGSDNSVFGHNANNLSFNGSLNAMFGKNAGQVNAGDRNSFFGASSGKGNTSGTGNSFFGDDSGLVNSTGSSNVFIGKNSAPANTIGSNNTFVGFGSGSGVISGTDNVFLGMNSGAVSNVSNSIAIGANVKAAASNSILLGTANHSVTIPGSTVFGETLEVNGNMKAKAFLTVDSTATFNSGVLVPVAGVTIGSGGISTTKAITAGGKLTVNNDAEVNGNIDASGELSAATIGAGDINVGMNITIVNGQGKLKTPNLDVWGTVKLSQNMASGGDGDFLCLDEDDFTVKYCFANIASMENSNELKSGLKTIGDLKAVSYQADGEQRLGLTPRDSNSVDPTVMKRDSKGVNVLQVIPALVSAIQEQQKQIEALKTMVCSKDPTAVVCVPSKQ
ncbi:MAG TPA: hypothetical protein VJL58_05435, partial [Pyrinomonadaceae bacterium]|nr:hypothetical protein [Pyrinomonadaceae bacterium]